MKRKILAGCILAVFIITVSAITAIGLKTDADENKESPLYKIRTQKAISEKINSLVDSIKTKFLGERVFWVPLIQRFPVGTITPPPSIGSEGGKGCLTCFFTCGLEATDCGYTCVVCQTIRLFCPK
jgi:hypothetical protein